MQLFPPPPPPGCIASSPPPNALTQHRLAFEKPQQRHFSLTVEQRPLNEQMERPSSVLLVALRLQPASIQATTALRKTTLYSACRHCTWTSSTSRRRRGAAAPAPTDPEPHLVCLRRSQLARYDEWIVLETALQSFVVSREPVPNELKAVWPSFSLSHKFYCPFHSMSVFVDLRRDFLIAPKRTKLVTTISSGQQTIGYNELTLIFPSLLYGQDLGIIHSQA